MPGASLNYVKDIFFSQISFFILLIFKHSSLSVDDTATYSQRVHTPPQYYYHHSIDQSNFYPYQSQLSVPSEHHQKSLVPTTDAKKCECKEQKILSKKI